MHGQIKGINDGWKDFQNAEKVKGRSCISVWWGWEVVAVTEQQLHRL